MAARFVEPPDNASATDMERLRGRAASLADADVAAYSQYVQARRRSGRESPETVEALQAAVDVPLQVAAISAEVAAVAEALATDGNPRLRGDASTGCWLAAGAAASAALLVAENVPGDARVEEANRYARRARDAASRLGG